VRVADEPNERAVHAVVRVGRFAVQRERVNPIVFLRKTNAESLPEVLLTNLDAFFSGRAFGVIAGLEEAVGCAEFDANADENRIGTGVIVGGSLLSAVAAGLRIRNVNDLSIGSEEPNLGDVRTCLGRREVMDVRFECRLS